MVAQQPLPEIHLSNLQWSTPQQPRETSPQPLSLDHSRDSSTSCSPPNPISYHTSSTTIKWNSNGSLSESTSQNSLTLLGTPKSTCASIHRNRSCSPTFSPSRRVRSMHEHGSPLSSRSDRSDYKQQRKIDVDPYSILGLNRDDDFDEVKRAYKRLALLCHPRRSASQFGSAQSSSTTSTTSSSRSNSTSATPIQNFHYSNSSRESFMGRDRDRDRDDHHNHNHNHNQPSNNEEECNEESIREWHFIVVAASYETLSDVEHRKHYDLIWNQSQVAITKLKKKKQRRKKGFWKSFRKDLDSRLDINDSFDLNDNMKDGEGEGVVECGCGNYNESSSSLFNVCGSVTRKFMEPSINSSSINSSINSSSNFNSNRMQRSSVSTLKLHSSRGGRKPMLDCKPLLLSDDENSQRQKSCGTEASAVTDEDGNDDFVREETNHLFGGPLAPMYKARQYQPFSDAFDLFRIEFGSDIFRSRSCFDDDDDDEGDGNNKENNGFAQKWVSGGNGRLSDEMKTATSSNFTISTTGSKPTLVYPVLPNIPLKVLDQYGVLDGRERHCKPDNKPTKVSKGNNNHLSTVVTNEEKNGISSEIVITTKINGNMRVVRTQTTTFDKDGKKKTVTSVRKESIPIEELKKREEEERIKKHEGFIDLVPCCSFSIPKESKKSSSRSIPDDVSVVSSTSSNSTLLSMKNFEDKKALKLRMKKLFLAQQRAESREEK